MYRTFFCNFSSLFFLQFCSFFVLLQRVPQVFHFSTDSGGFPSYAGSKRNMFDKQVQLINAFYRCCVDAKDASLSRKLREQALRKPTENKEKETTNQKNFI